MTADDPEKVLEDGADDTNAAGIVFIGAFLALLAGGAFVWAGEIDRTTAFFAIAVFGCFAIGIVQVIRG